MAALEQCCSNLGVLQLPRVGSLHRAGRGRAFLPLSKRLLQYKAMNLTRLVLHSCLVRAQASTAAKGDVAASAVSSVEMPEAAGNLAEHEKVQTYLVLMRHGESMWNDLKLFIGDVDIPLTEKEVMEALAGGKAVSEIDFDIIFTSRLVRSKQTALIAMTQSKYKRVPVLVRGGYYGKGKTAR